MKLKATEKTLKRLLSYRFNHHPLGANEGDSITHQEYFFKYYCALLSVLCFFLNPNNNFITIFVFLLSSLRLARRGGYEYNCQHLLLVIIKYISFSICHHTLKILNFFWFLFKRHSMKMSVIHSYLHLLVRSYVHSHSNLIPLILRSSNFLKAVKKEILPHCNHYSASMTINSMLIWIKFENIRENCIFVILISWDF